MILFFSSHLSFAMNNNYHLSPNDSANTTDRDCHLRNGEKITIGILNDLGAPLRITFDDSISGIEADYIRLFIPCPNNDVKIVTYDDERLLIDDLNNKKIDFIILNKDIHSENYSSTKFISEKYVALNKNALDVNKDEIQVGYVNNCFTEAFIQQGYKVIKCEKFDNAKRAYIAMINGNVDISVLDYYSAMFFIKRFDSEKINISTYLNERFERFIISNNKPLYDRAVEYVYPRYYKELIKSTWGINNNNPINLTDAEINWIKTEKPIIKVVFSGSFAPYTFYDNSGKELGIIPELLTTIGIKTGLKFQWVRLNKFSDIKKNFSNGNAHMVASSPYYEKLSEQIAFSIPYSIGSLSVVTRKDLPKEKTNDVIAVVESYKLQEYLRNTYPNAEIKIVSNTSLAIELVAKEEATSAYGYSEVVNFIVDTYFNNILESKLYPTEYKVDMRFAISKQYKNHEMLKNILDKSIYHLGFNYVDNLSERWNSYLVDSDMVWVEKETKLKLYVYIISGILILITVYLFLFYIREKKRKKELLEWQFRANLIDGIPIPIAVRDDKSRFIHYNKAFSEFSSLKNPDQILGKKTSEYPSRLIDNTFFKNEEKEYLELLKSKSHGQKIIKLTIENRELTLRFWWVPYVIDCNITGLITGWVDLTEINYLNDQLIKSRDEAINANKDKSNFLAVMSHEIRTPLNAILGTLELSLLNVNERDRYLKQAYDSSLGLLDIVNNILEISKLEVSEKDLTLTYIEVATLLNNVATSFLGLCNKKNLDLKIDIHHDESHYIFSDCNYIKQILNNILSNAIKYTESGFIKIISTLKDEHIEIDINDTGIGMTDKQLSELYQPFVTDSTNDDSYGLGLSIVHKLCNMLNIKINITSTINIGTNVNLSIPITSRSIADLHRSIARNDIPSTKLSGKKVLVIDDHRINRDIIEKQLILLEMDVSTCSTGQEAWKLYNEVLDKFNIIITDCYMPEMSGFEFTELIRMQELKNKEKSIPIIGFTANAQADMVEQCLVSGMTDCMFKPINIKKLHEKICTNLTQFDTCIDIVRIRKFAYETSQSLKNMLLNLLTALEDEVKTLSIHGLSTEERLESVHKLKGVVQILGDFDLLNSCDCFENEPVSQNLLNIINRVNNSITILKETIKTGKV